MAKTATARKAPLPSTGVTETRAALARLKQNFTVELSPYRDEAAALAWRAAAQQITVTDKDSHRDALEAIKRGKPFTREMDTHWRQYLRWLDARKDDIRTILQTHLEIVAPQLTRLTAECLAYETAEKQREAAEAETRRRAEVCRAQEARDRELAEMERQALAAESQSEQLSDRERAFVQRCFGVRGVSLSSPQWLNTQAVACGFKQEGYGVALMAKEKIRYALEAMQQATALREQAAAVAAKPVEVQPVEVESQRATVAGVRSHVSYTGECVDFDLFIDRFVAGAVDRTTFRALILPNTVGGNEMARALRENFDRIPGWRHVRRETKAG